MPREQLQQLTHYQCYLQVGVLKTGAASEKQPPNIKTANYQSQGLPPNNICPLGTGPPLTGQTVRVARSSDWQNTQTGLSTLWGGGFPLSQNPDYKYLGTGDSARVWNLLWKTTPRCSRRKLLDALARNMGGGRRVGFNIPLADTQVAAHAPAAEFPVEGCS